MATIPNLKQVQLVSMTHQFKDSNASATSFPCIYDSEESNLSILLHYIENHYPDWVNAFVPTLSELHAISKNTPGINLKRVEDDRTIVITLRTAPLECIENVCTADESPKDEIDQLFCSIDERESGCTDNFLTAKP